MLKHKLCKRISMLFLVLVLMSTSVFAGGEAGAVSSAGHGSTYVIKNDGSLWGWGGQYTGAGNGFKEVQVTPVKILDNVRSVSANGSDFAVAVKKDDTMWGWGDLYGYPYADGEKGDRTVPTLLAIDDVKSAASGLRFVLALKNDGTLWICGQQYIGDGTTTQATGDDGFKLMAENVKDMYANKETIFIIKEDDTLWGVGMNDYAQLGNMTMEGDESLNVAHVLSFTKILDNVIFVNGCPDGYVNFAIRKDNSLYAWGTEGFYTEENGWVENAGKPYKVMDQVKFATADGDKAYIIKSDNSLWSWGYSYEGKTVANEQVPYLVTDNVVSISLGERHAALVKTDNTLWVMGGNYRNGLGYDINETWYTPLTKIIDDVQDAPASWAYEEVEKAIGAQLIPEELQGQYSKPITREEFCKLAIQMIEVRAEMPIEDYLGAMGTEIAPIGTFIDCDTKAVRAAKSLGITSGTSETEFSPDKLLTREQAAKFLTATAIACGRDVELTAPNYADVDQIANWAKEYTGYVNKIGVMKGVGGNRFDPEGSYQRQQAFMTMYRIWLSIDSVNIDRAALLTGATEPQEDYKDLEEIKSLVGSIEYEGLLKQVTLTFDEYHNEGMDIEYSYPVTAYFDGHHVRLETNNDITGHLVEIYNATDNATYGTNGFTGYYEKGNALGVSRLSVDMIEAIEVGDYKDYAIEIKGNELYFTIDTGDKIWDYRYSLIYGIPLSYGYIGTEGGPLTTGLVWKNMAFEDQTPIDESYFEIPDAVKNQ